MFLKKLEHLYMTHLNRMHFTMKKNPEEIISAWVLQHTNANGKQWESAVAAGTLPSPHLRANQRRWSSVDLKEQGWQQAIFEMKVPNHNWVIRNWQKVRRTESGNHNWGVSCLLLQRADGWLEFIHRGHYKPLLSLHNAEFHLKLRFHLYSIWKSTFFLHVVVNCSIPNSSINT